MTPFYLGVVTGLVGAACIAGLYGFLLQFRRRPHEPDDWSERAYAPPVVTSVTHQSINRIREIHL